MQHHARSASQDLGQNVMEDWLNWDSRFDHSAFGPNFSINEPTTLFERAVQYDVEKPTDMMQFTTSH